MPNATGPMGILTGDFTNEFLRGSYGNHVDSRNLDMLIPHCKRFNYHRVSMCNTCGCVFCGVGLHSFVVFGLLYHTYGTNMDQPLAGDISEVSSEFKHRRFSVETKRRLC